MRTITHRLFGATTAVAAVHYAPAWVPVTVPHGWHVGLFVAAAAVMSGGYTSPDADNSRFFHTADSVLPDELLGCGGPLKHRGIMHWVGWPVVAAVALWPLTLSAWVAAVAWGAVVGWASHLFGDALFGKANTRAGLGQGVPLLGWTGYVGLGLKADGPTERLTAAALCGALAWLLWTGWGLWPTAVAGLVVAVGVVKGAIRPARVVTA